MQNKSKPQAPRKGTVSTSGKKSRRVKKKMSAMTYDSVGLYRRGPLIIQTPGASSLRMPGTKGKEVRLPRNLSQDGMAFLKCAFAPPDFAYNAVSGAPDDYEGSSLVKKHRFVSSLTVPANTDRYIILLPTPGYAYWQLDLAAGTAPNLTNAIFKGAPYSDFNTMFQPGAIGVGSDDVVDRFRYVSNHIELVPTVNATSWTGSIQVWKGPVNLITRPGTNVSYDSKSVSGLQSSTATNANQYTAPFNMGAYSGAYNSGAKFDFTQITSYTANVPNVIELGDFGQLTPLSSAGGAATFTGMDNNFESVFIKISGVGANTTNSYVLKTWACVEYQVVTGSSLYEYQTLSPCDPLAMKLYREIIKQLPIGVSYLDNDTFWERVLGIIRMISGGMSFIPGPVGAIAGGINAAATLLS